MSVYFDTSVLAALFVEDVFTARARNFLRSRPVIVAVSDFAMAEFSSVIARLVRNGDATAQGARATFAAFDRWTAKETAIVQTETTDIRSASAFIRLLELPLRAPDAIHIAIAQRMNAELFTFDKHMAESARKLGISMIEA